jgi:hypothetical protein
VAVSEGTGENVLLRKRHGAADFEVVVVSSTVKDIRINPDRE